MSSELTQEEQERREFYNSQAWRKKRKDIKKRDNNECQWCKKEGRVTIDTGTLNRNGRKKNALIVHHIKERLEHPELALDDDNLVTVCFKCHEQHHERWTDNVGKQKENKWTADEKW